ncbi:hypothetical protein ACEWY4_011802 [Coilia grayii]|uniref:Sperm acrosome associated 9 n=1 Tax=Coilia grayii TaxID=363190 RepID=A0ABD1JYP8_9TELE
MNEVRESLTFLEKKCRRFKQQQFIFISALERAKEQAQERTQPVRTVTQVQKYMTQHCNSATDRTILAFFLEIVSDLNKVLRLVKSCCPSTDALATCNVLLHPESDISQLRAQYPHDEILRLSCETRNYYGGVVSLVPLALDLLSSASPPEGTPSLSLVPTAVPTATAPAPIPAPTPTPAPTLGPSPEKRPTPPRSACSHGTSKKPAGDRRAQSARISRKARPTCTAAWQAGRPAWRPPGNTTNKPSAY